MQRCNIWQVKSHVKISGRFGGTCHLQIQDRRVNHTRNLQQASVKTADSCLPVSKLAANFTAETPTATTTTDAAATAAITINNNNNNNFT
jgi:hypothetical protein